MTGLIWAGVALLLFLAAWLVLAVVVGLLVGGAVRVRDRQVPDDEEVRR